LENLSSILLDSLEYFVIGHEYGHIYYNHFYSAKLEAISLNKINNDLVKICTNWEQEFQADIFGAQLIMDMDKSGEKFPFSVLGPELLFSFFYYKYLFGDKNNDKLRQESDTHPAPLKRKELVREYILSKYCDKDKEILSLTFKLIDDIFKYHVNNYKSFEKNIN
jgi:hypothetical protein